MTHHPRRAKSVETPGDAARRIADIVNAQAVAQPFDVLVRSWMAFKLSDGTSDGVLYDSRPDAIRHQSNESECLYLCLREAPGGMLPMQAQALINFHRMAYDAGGRVTHPSDRQMIMPLAREDVMSQYRRLLRSSGHSFDRYREG